jgi:hypothetical protein
MSFCYATLIVLLLVALLVGWRLIAAKRRLQAALAGWGAPTTQTCDGAIAITPTACGQLLADPGPPPPGVTQRGRPLSAGHFDPAATAYAIRIVARLIAYLGTGTATYVSLTGMRPPVFTTVAQDKTYQLAATWITADGTSAVVAIRGTKTLGDLIADLKFSEDTLAQRNQPAAQATIMAVLPGTRAIEGLGAPATPLAVHRGMYGVYSSARPSLLAALPSTVRSVFIAGHSMGAAIAFYYALDLAQKDLTVEVHGLAPPRAGNAAFAAAVAASASASSLINMADLVPGVPWTYMPNTDDPTKPIEYAHVQPVAAFNARMPDIGSCHALTASVAGLPVASVVAVPAV